MGFWTTRVYSLSEFYFALVTLFSGQFVPLQLMPKVVQDIAQFLPFQMFRYVPIEVILGRLSMADMLRDYAVGLLWLVLAWFIFSRVWRAGVKRFSAVGA
jgi:ABC-2 type transport system permease protein